MVVRTISLVGTVLVLTVGSFAGGFVVGRTALDASEGAESPPANGDRDWIEEDLLRFDFVQDALSRWAKKNGTSPSGILAVQSPQAMSFPHRMCAQFVQRKPALGGAAPVYCYKLDEAGWPTTQLIYEASALGE